MQCARRRVRSKCRTDAARGRTGRSRDRTPAPERLPQRKRAGDREETLARAFAPPPPTVDHAEPQPEERVLLSAAQIAPRAAKSSCPAHNLREAHRISL